MGVENRKKKHFEPTPPTLTLKYSVPHSLLLASDIHFDQPFSSQSVSLATSQSVRQPHPSSFDQLSPEFFGGVVEGELLTAQVVDWWVALQVKEKVVVETHFFGLLLNREKNEGFKSPYTARVALSHRHFTTHNKS